ncbi:MAG: hypothetical protein MRJ96_11425 [Nitrospirales bacterium]|nr:hypothetical protein [Nitrospira sp.]MDR4502050.1 hypothetical protein [Nitrospirales bacterium]
MPKSTKTDEADRGTTDTLTELMRVGARKLIAQALEAEGTCKLPRQADSCKVEFSGLGS